MNSDVNVNYFSQKNNLWLVCYLKIWQALEKFYSVNLCQNLEK